MGFVHLMPVCALLIYAGQVSSVSNGADRQGQPSWGYEEGPDGPAKWGDKFPDCKKGQQSPIDIKLKDTVKADFPALKFNGYDTKPSSAVLTNNGRTAVLKLGDVTAEVSGGPLGQDTYVYRQLHFHWGKTNKKGSENTFDNTSFPLEMHIVHYNKKYGTFNEALNHDDGLAVLSFIFWAGGSNPAYMSLVAALQQVKMADSSAKLRKKLALSAYISGQRNKYLTYRGSLTTPPCSEVVTWLVFGSAIPISSKQLQQFRRILNHENAAITHNFRPTQPLNGRIVQRSK